MRPKFYASWISSTGGSERAFMSIAFCSGMVLWISRMDFKCTLLQTEWILTPIRCHLLWSKGYYRLSGLWFCCTHALPCCVGACDHGGETGFWFRDGKNFPGSPGLFSLHIFFQSDFGYRLKILPNLLSGFRRIRKRWKRVDFLSISSLKSKLLFFLLSKSHKMWIFPH